MIASAVLAYQLFSQARMYWDSQTYPRYVDYVVRVQVHDKKRGDRIESYASAYDSAYRRIWIDPVSDYEHTHPATGKGIGFGAAPTGPGPAPDQDFIGVPVLAPNYAFTLRDDTIPETVGALTPQQLVAQIRTEFHDPHPTSTNTPGALPTITSVRSREQNYDISLVGEEEVDDTRCYHLALQPHHVDGRYRLRDLWIDEKTYATVRARTALNFVNGPGTTMPWLIHFADVEGSRYITSETAEGTYRYGGRTYSQVTVSFDQIHVRTTPLPIHLADFAVFLKLLEP